MSIYIIVLLVMRAKVCLFYYYSDTKGLSDKANVIKSAGERDSLWSPGWSPRETKELRAYLGDRIKTTLKRRKERSWLCSRRRTNCSYRSTTSDFY